MRQHVFGERRDADDYIAAVNQRLGYPKPGRFPSGLVRDDGVGRTETHARVLQHTRLAEFAVPVVADVDAPKALRTGELDSADWGLNADAVVAIGR